MLACRNFFESNAMNLNSEYRIQSRPNAIALVHKLSELGVYQACVTSVPHWQAQLNIEALGISHHMQFIQMLDDGIPTKPSPDLYQLAIKKMEKIIEGLKKSEILVIEDSFPGVISAHAAGLHR